MALIPDVEQVLTGWWAVHPSGRTLLAEQRFARRPRQHIVFDGPAWRRYETGRRWRRKHAGVSAGFWRTVDVDGAPLLVLTVRSYRPSRVSQAMIDSNRGSSTVGLAIFAEAAHGAEADKMRDGEAKMYFLLVHLEPDRITVTVPSDGSDAPRQRWVRVAR